MTFTRITKTIVNLRVIETPLDIVFRGVMQPLSPKRLDIKPEGQRAWTWKTVHAEPALKLNIDDIITYKNTPYRVMAKSDYTAHGYVYYELAEGFIQ
jgi:hypothetical protein